MTKNLVPGEAVYGEKRISIEAPLGSNPAATNGDTAATKTEYRVWNPFRSKLAAGILGGLDNIFIAPGSKVLYLGAASGTSVSHVSDIVGPTGVVYAVEFSHRSGRDLIGLATKRTNIIPIVEDARHPMKYRMLVGMVDVIFADVAQPDQARIVGLNAHMFLKQGGGVVSLLPLLSFSFPILLRLNPSARTPLTRFTAARLRQGILHRLHQARRAGLRPGSHQHARRADQAAGAAHPRAL